MSSLLTNASALTALQNLAATQKSLSNTQEQISTGLAVGNAKDNTAYWSIGQTMSSDNGALGAVSASLKQNSAMLANFASAINQAISVVNNIKNDLVSATNTQDDKKLKQIQTDIAAQQASLVQIVSGASFNGQNWLDGTINDASDTKLQSGTTKLTGAYTNAGGVAYISVATKDVGLVDGAGGGTLAVTSTGGVLGTAVGAGTATYSVLGASNGAGSSGRIMLYSAATGGTAQSHIDDMISAVDATIIQLELSASTIGAAQAQINTQQTFVSTMQTNLTNGVSALVDADMNQVSTRLQALQTQQQLGVQSLSIANQSSQMILKLFQ